MLQTADLTIRLHPEDDVVIARVEIPAGTLVAKENVRALVAIPAGHKIAVRAIGQGKPAKRYNQVIGFATRAIKAGERFFELVLKTASGEKTKSELFGYGEDEFAPWTLGATM